MKRRVLKWNLTVLNTETQTKVIDVDYDYDKHRAALRDMLEDQTRPNAHIYIRRIKKVVRIEERPAPGVEQFKQLVGLGKDVLRKVIG